MLQTLFRDLSKQLPRFSNITLSVSFQQCEGYVELSGVSIKVQCVELLEMLQSFVVHTKPEGNNSCIFFNLIIRGMRSGKLAEHITRFFQLSVVIELQGMLHTVLRATH